MLYVTRMRPSKLLLIEAEKMIPKLELGTLHTREVGQLASDRCTVL